MIRTFMLPLGVAAALLACAPAGRAQTSVVPVSRVGGSDLVRIPIPRVHVQPIVPQNFINQNYVYQYPNGYVPYTPLITVRRSPAVPQQNLSINPDPTDHLNGLQLSRIPRAQSNQLNLPARSDVRYSNRLVADAQQNLRRLGYYTGMVDGNLGPETASAIQRYQMDHRLPVTGLLDSAMLSQLGIVTPAR